MLRPVLAIAAIAAIAPCCAMAEPLRPPVEPKPALGVPRCR